MQRPRFGAIDLQTALAGLAVLGFCYAAWLTSIVFSAAHGARPLLIAAATFFPIGIVHGIGVWFGGW
jgi:ABC-type arginine transport system permease subunit